MVILLLHLDQMGHFTWSTALRHSGGFLVHCDLHGCCFLGCNAGSPSTLRSGMLHLFTNDSSPSDSSESAISLESESVSEVVSLDK